MSPAMVPIAVGSMLTTIEELDALPVRTVIMADPDGNTLLESQCQMALQKRADAGADPGWYAARAWTAQEKAETKESSVAHGQHYGPFQVLWLPPYEEAAAEAEATAEVAA